jgi:hypothetical protein
LQLYVAGIVQLIVADSSPIHRRLLSCATKNKPYMGG